MTDLLIAAPPADAAATPDREVKIAARRRRLTIHTLQLTIVAAALGVWELGARGGHISTFLFASPSSILTVLRGRLETGELMTDLRVTSTEVLIGFVLGAIGGSAVGLLLWYSTFVADLTAPFISAIGAIPILAIAPITIIWFGTGMASKIFIVALSCVVVSLTTAYRGAQRTDPDLLNLMRSFGASRTDAFCKVVVPGSMTWVMSGLKLNVGFSIVGAIVGEYISSDAGVGHMILLGSSNFSINIVLAGIAVVMVMVLAFTLIVTTIERFVLSWERAAS